jgi:hypothetical protein
VGKLNEGKGEREIESGATGGRWSARGARARPGRAGLGHVAGQNPTTRTTTDRNPIVKRNPE